MGLDRPNLVRSGLGRFPGLGDRSRDPPQPRLEPSKKTKTTPRWDRVGLGSF